MRAPTIILVALAVALSIAGVASSASAQPEAERTALARSLFEEGVQLASRGDYQAAAERFRRARGLVDSPGISFNLARTLVQLGELVDANEALRSVIRSEGAPRSLVQEAQALQQQIAPRIARLTIRLDGPPQGVEVRIDDSPVAEAAIGIPMPADPGEHRIEAHRGGSVVAEDSVELSEGGSAEVTLAIPPAPELPAPEVETEEPEPQPLAPPPDRDEGGSIFGQWWFWTGAVILVAGGVVGGLYLSGQFDAPPAIAGNTDPGVIQWD